MLPHPIRTVIASVRGYQLYWWRYSGRTEALVEEALERDNWTSDQWLNWQQERLAFILHHAATKVPYYKEYWQKIKRRNPLASWNYIENWPVLEKESVRRNPKAFIAQDSRSKLLFIDHTSGTSGKPTLIYQSRDTVNKWYALMEARLRRWNNIRFQEKWGMFGGQVIIPLNQKSPPYWIHNWGLNQLYFSVYHISKETAKYYIDALNKFQPTYLIVYPSILATLSVHIVEQNLIPPRISAIFCNAEKVLEKHRLLISKAFNCPIIETYGMAELTSTACQCQAGTMHEWPEVGYLEIFNSQSKTFITDMGEAGEFVMTGLINDDMPLIRYANGDIGSLPDKNFNCACGKSLPRFGQVQGRTKDLIKTKDGNKLYILDSVFKGLPIIEAQVIQENYFTIKIVVVKEDNFSEFDSDEIKVRLSKFLGDQNYLIEIVDRIPRERNGKFRPFISKLPEN